MPGRRVPEDITLRLFDRVQALLRMPNMPVIAADMIAEQIDQLESDETPPAASYGVVAPPFARFFVEALTRPDADATVPGYEHMPPIPKGTVFIRGMACYVVTPTNEQQLMTREHYAVMPGGTRWAIAMWGYQWLSWRRQFGYYTSPLFIHLDNEGRWLDDPEYIYGEPLGTFGGISVVLGPPDALSTEFFGIEPLPQHVMGNYLPFTLRALAAMHRRCPVDRVLPSGARRREAKREKVEKVHDFFVLKVKPTPAGERPTLASIGQPEHDGQRAHSVRGHFRHYHPDRPMFGRRIEGATIGRTIWVPEHKRGDDSYGEITKDYEVIE